MPRILRRRRTEMARVQHDWEEFARAGALWSILSDPDQPNRRWDLDEFFLTGQREWNHMLRVLEGRGLRPTEGPALDFGCGVGRVTRALAEHFGEAVGVDAAPTMIRLARRYNRSQPGCRFLVNQQPHLRMFEDASFPFVYSSITLQHIPPPNAERYVAELIRVLRPGGVAMFQVPSERNAPDPKPRRTVADGPLPHEAFRAKVVLDLPEEPLEARPGESVVVHPRARNDSARRWPAGATDHRYQVRVANRWARRGRIVVRDDGRADLPHDVDPGEEVSVALGVRAPRRTGPHVLLIDLVQEGVAWFSDCGSPVLEVPVRIRRGRRRAVRERSSVEAGPRMEMFALPEERVRRVVEDGGGRIVHAYEDGWAGPDWRSLRYIVAKPTGRG